MVDRFFGFLDWDIVLTALVGGILGAIFGLFGVVIGTAIGVGIGKYRSDMRKREK